MKLIKVENKINVTSSRLEVYDTLPNGTYSIKQDPRTFEFFLIREVFDSFSIPSKLYGNPNEVADKVVRKYSLRKNNLGVLLVGLKGSGKSVTSKLICNKANVPVILLSEYFDSGDLLGFLSSITQRFVLFIDEFEKIFNENAQERILSILDGTSETNMLVLLTANSSYKIINPMRNRPSRVHYRFNYGYLTENEILEVLNDTISDENVVKEILELCNIVGGANYDLLKSVIEEINDFGFEGKAKLLNSLNIEIEEVEYDVTCDLGDGKYFSCRESSNPQTSEMYFSERVRNIDGSFYRDEDGDNDYFYITLSPKKHTSCKPINKGYEIVQDGKTFIFKRYELPSLTF